MSKEYRFLPFRFKRFGRDVLLINDIGEYYFLNENRFKSFVDKQLDTTTEDFFDLLTKHMVFTDCLPQIIELLSTAYRTKKKYLYDFTSLHMFVVTHRCNQKCTYCHASSEDNNKNPLRDMNLLTAKKCVDLALRSPSNNMKFEFQGGEPLLNFEVIKEVVEYTKHSILHKDRHVEFVVCTNLTKLKEEHLFFFQQNNICISTSLDGPKRIHDQFRKTRDGDGTYDLVCQKITESGKYLGNDKVSALITVTQSSLNYLNDVIDKYVEIGLSSIFIRMINQHGYAEDEWCNVGYSVEEFLAAYEKALNYIITLNKSGVFFAEEYATLLLTKILTPFCTGFVDLQSPSGAGIGGVVYEINGDVFIADEARMMAKKTGNKTFCIGNAFIDSYGSMFCGKKLFKLAIATTIESIPGCAWCVYQPYCGSDLIKNYVQYGNYGNSQSKTDFCKKQKAIFDILFQYLKSNEDSTIDVFWSWVTRRNLSEIIMNNQLTK